MTPDLPDTVQMVIRGGFEDNFNRTLSELKREIHHGIPVLFVKPAQSIMAFSALHKETPRKSR